MIQTANGIENLTLDVKQEMHVLAPVDVTFETLLEQIGPYNERGPGDPMPMKIEAWPGGRWYRDLGDNNGHLWGHVQAIKRPTLLEITGRCSRRIQWCRTFNTGLRKKTVARSSPSVTRPTGRSTTSTGKE